MFQILINREEKENFFFKILKMEKRKRMKIQFFRARGSERGQYFSRFLEIRDSCWCLARVLEGLYIGALVLTQFLTLRHLSSQYVDNISGLLTFQTNTVLHQNITMCSVMRRRLTMWKIFLGISWDKEFFHKFPETRRVLILIRNVEYITVGLQLLYHNIYWTVWNMLVNCDNLIGIAEASNLLGQATVWRTAGCTKECTNQPVRATLRKD